MTFFQRHRVTLIVVAVLAITVLLVLSGLISSGGGTTVTPDEARVLIPMVLG
jgi:membrane-bound acyltransferase YfiQ involved in biofilm formation